MYVYTELGQKIKAEHGIKVEVGQEALFCGEKITTLSWNTTQKWLDKGFIEWKSQSGS